MKLLDRAARRRMIVLGGLDDEWHCACSCIENTGDETIDCQWTDEGGRPWQVVVTASGVAYTMCWSE